MKDIINSILNAYATETMVNGSRQDIIKGGKFRALSEELNDLFNAPNTCPHCGRNFDRTEVESGVFCCRACENGY